MKSQSRQHRWEQLILKLQKDPLLAFKLASAVPPIEHKSPSSESVQRIILEVIHPIFKSSGLGADDEPTEYGRSLEGLLDEVNRFRLRAD